MTARILVIEDNADNLDVMTCLLESFGHIPVHARDGVEGLEKAAFLRPDLIICDLQMPKLSGFEVCQQLKSDPALKHIPLLAVTAQAMVGDRERVLESGFNGYISKPINPRNFVQQVESYLIDAVQDDRHSGQALAFERSLEETDNG